MTISGYRGRLGDDAQGCKCTRNGRALCRVPKSKSHPSGWTFIKGTDPRAQRCKKR